MSKNNMKYFKNIEIARKFAINPTTVQNWIDASTEGKNDLELLRINDRNYIIDSPQNAIMLDKLAESSRKYKHKSLRKVVEARPELFEYLRNDQIADVINNLQMHSEIPHKYAYVDGGAKMWQKYVLRSVNDNMFDTVNSTIKLLKIALPLISFELEGYSKVNIIDIGCGEGTPLKQFLENFINNRMLKKYVGIDISESMIEIAKDNLRDWFGGNIDAHFVNRDINHSAIDDLLFFNVNDKRPSNTRNLAMFLGNTLENQLAYTRTLINLSSSLGSDDLLLIGTTLDNELSKVHFDFSTHQKGSKIKYFDDEDQYRDWQDFVIPTMLGLDISDFDVQLFYNEKENSRMTQLICKKDFEIIIKNKSLDTKIELYRGQKITTWRHNHTSIQEKVVKYSQCGLAIKHILTTPDESHALIICRRV